MLCQRLCSSDSVVCVRPLAFPRLPVAFPELQRPGAALQDAGVCSGSCLVLIRELA